MYRFLEHPSETMVEVRAPTESEIFQDAAFALFEVMTDTSTVQHTLQFPVELKSTERKLLLVDWLNRLIYLHETEDVFLASFTVEVGHEENTWRLRALVAGDRIGQNQERRSHVKSATYGMLEWFDDSSGHVARFILDI